MKPLIAIAGVITVIAIGLWLATGLHPYTKFEDVVQEETPIDADDPFAEAGFYDEDETITQVVTRDVFYFGFLPTPQSIMDKHALSVSSVVIPVWLVVGVIAIVRRQASRQIRGSSA